MEPFEGKSLILGVYEPAEKDGQFILTPSSKEFNQRTNGKLENILKIAGKKLKCGKSRVLYGLDESFPAVAVANLGKQDVGFDENEQLDQGKENVRAAVAGAVTSLREAGQTEVAVDSCGDAEAAAEGCTLSLFSFDELKQEDKRQTAVNVNVFTAGADDIANADASWSKGVALAEGQNFARRLKENPANKMTPTIFCEEVVKNLGSIPNVKITIHGKEWAESKKMGAFLSVSQGSAEPLKFLEIDYDGGKSGDPPVVFVGKGITFDSGGISIKPSAEMDKMRADMGGAACVVSSIQAAASLAIPINVKGLVPLCENMPGGKATKPGDVVTAMNGKTIQVDNTDAEGRLILADALCYAETFNPRLILDIATLTGAVVVALGSTAAAAYTKSDFIWQTLNDAGKVTGDRVWRMPLFKYYTKIMTTSDLADLNNIGGKREAGSCTAAAFLQEFVTTDKWVHVDMAGVMMNTNQVPYLGQGMSGRPTRTLTRFLENLSNQTA
ncbi:cytosol aminopeptidase [Aplysia californica]|uniref:Cytosol aminopeptidase n=1 Tax=Aplysia californica TaxID=6500 RepID=A0ABM1VT44_APLCA|nr:cytosol aminopeptidase [Aplysia californica]